MQQQQPEHQVNGVTDRLRHEMMAYEDKILEQQPNAGLLYGRIAPVKQGQCVRGVSID
jgi:hypothetical protein